MTLKTEQHYNSTRNHPVCRHLIPLESTFGLPVPLKRGETIYLRFLVYNKGRDANQATHTLYRPFAQLSVVYTTGELVEYLHLSFSAGESVTPRSTPIGVTPHAALAPLSFAEVVAKRTDYFAAVDEIVRAWREGKMPANLSIFAALFELLIEPELWTYYQTLNPALVSGQNSTGTN